MNDRAHEIAQNPKYDGFQRGLASMVSTFCDKKAISGVKVSVNKEVAQELHKPLIKKFKRRRVSVKFKDNIAEIF